MKQNSVKGTLILLITAFVWGCAFVAQTEGGAVVGAFAYNAARNILGALVLVPVFLLLDLAKRRAGTYQKPTQGQTKQLWLGGLLCGLALFVATTLQQLGINAGTDAGKAGFITALYILLVPVLGLVLRRPVSWRLWPCVAVALVGLYLLCMNGGLALETGDALIMGCSLVFSVHILLADHFAPLVDNVRLSAIQFLVCAVLSSLATLIADEIPTPQALASAWLPIVYAGVMSSGVAYTLQIIGQKYTSPTVGALVMSLESVFAVLAGAVLLRQIPTSRELLGCGLMFAAIIAAQLPGRKKAKA